jgi:hypothetical protein
MAPPQIWADQDSSAARRMCDPSERPGASVGQRWRRVKHACGFADQNYMRHSGAAISLSPLSEATINVVERRQDACRHT